MEEKKVVKLGTTGVLLIIAIIVIAIMSMFLCKLSKEKASAELQASQLQTQVNSLNGTISSLNNTIKELQRKLSIISDTINSTSQTANESATNAQELIIGKWRVEKVFDKEGNELSLNDAFGSGIGISNEMEFKENGVLQYRISITPSSDDGEYTIEENTIKYGVPSDTKDVLIWHTATYNAENDTIEEQNIFESENTVIYTRIK